METAIIKTDLVALATTVSAKLTAVFEGLAEIAEITTAVGEAEQDRHNNRDKKDESMSWDESYGDYRLAKVIAQSVGAVREAIIHPSFGGSLGDIAKAVEDRAHHYEIAGEARARQAEIAATLAAQEAGETVERVASGFTLISAFLKERKEGRTKRHSAHVLYSIDGVLFEELADFDAKTRAFIGSERSIGLHPTNRTTGELAPLFRGGMTAEEIGKAAHIKDNIVSYLRAEIGFRKRAA
ncbi:hypothetical protein AMC83_PA00088 (plasmid) [Rhizobium phaseoli]|uniref:hypothetical protein n=1 Tax=Rhizobium phaseoli TaxID=396 RepID=UPI0007EBFCDF|nr:hypothetical protein [Rhizobium phaseoli]ANL74315.1 hypothetical protein AMC83_PA00088 [Rhizobium phaseoli]